MNKTVVDRLTSAHYTGTGILNKNKTDTFLSDLFANMGNSNNSNSKANSNTNRGINKSNIIGNKSSANIISKYNNTNNTGNYADRLNNLLK